MYNRFYRKPKPETMKKNREFYAETFKEEIKWLKEHMSPLNSCKNKFLLEMYQILVTGSRKITPKMATAIQNGIKKCNQNPNYNESLRTEANAKIRPMLEKIAMVERLAEQKGDRAIDFVRNVKEYVKNNYRMTKKQMESLNKVYKRVSEDLFDDKG